MDAAEARRQQRLVDSVNRLENESRRQGHTLDTILGTLEQIRDRLDDADGGAGVREPRTPAPESPGDAIAQDYADSAE